MDQIRERVVAARRRQHERFAGKRNVVTCNARMGTRDLKAFCALDEATQELLKTVRPNRVKDAKNVLRSPRASPICTPRPDDTAFCAFYQYAPHCFASDGNCVNLDEKKQILRASKALLNRYIFDRTVVLAIHDEHSIHSYGTGMLLRIEEQPLIITAAHVIKDVDPETIQVITTEEPSNFRLAPRMGDLYGGDFDQDLDVGFLQIRSPQSPLLSRKRFLGLADLEFFPQNLTHDLAILFGMPGAEHREPIQGVHSFGSFTYMTSFPGDLDWASPGNRPAILSAGYDESVEDVFSGKQIELPDPHGMSGGGLWRARFAGAQIWTADRLRLVGILTEFDGGRREVTANRVENLYHLLSHHFSLPDIY